MALLGSAVKSGETELAAEVYQQMSASSLPLSKQAFQVALEVFLKLGRWKHALAVLAQMTAQVRHSLGKQLSMIQRRHHLQTIWCHQAPPCSLFLDHAFDLILDQPSGRGDWHELLYVSVRCEIRSSATAPSTVYRESRDHVRQKENGGV